MNALRRGVQRLVAEPGAVLDLQLEAADVPRPCTGGGGNMAMNASWIDGELLVELHRDGAGRSGPAPCARRRASASTKTMPALELLVKPLIDRPGNATAFSTPGCFRAISLMRRMTSSVRSSVAPSGSCAKPTRYCLSWAGTKPPGTALNRPTVSADQHQVDADHDRLAREHAADAAAVGVASRAEHPVEAAEEPAERAVHDARQRGPSARRGPSAAAPTAPATASAS